MAEWLKAHAWKACLGETLTWVRIPLSPPLLLLSGTCKSVIPTLIPESERDHRWPTEKLISPKGSKPRKGWRYCRVVLSANGRVKPDLVIVNGKSETHKEGAYYLEWREGGKRVRLSVGKDPADASARRQRKEAELNAVNNGVAVVPDSRTETDHWPLPSPITLTKRSSPRSRRPWPRTRRLSRTL